MCLKKFHYASTQDLFHYHVYLYKLVRLKLYPDLFIENKIDCISIICLIFKYVILIFWNLNYFEHAECFLWSTYATETDMYYLHHS